MRPCVIAATLLLSLARTIPAAAAERSVAVAASPSPMPMPTPTQTAAPASDPCGGPGRLLATLNRPTVGYSACAVPAGAIVLEEGYQSTVQRGASPSIAIAYPQGFERVGIADRLELDLVGPTENRTTTPGGLVGGASDLGLGFKYELPQRGRFTYGFDGLFTAATGTGGSSMGPSETLDVDASYALSPAIGVGTTLSGSSSVGAYALGQQRYGYFLPSAVVTAQIPNYYQFYAELVDQTKLGPAQGGHVFTDFGLQKLLGPYLEVDVEYGASFTPVDGSRFSYLGFGAGVRVK